MRIGGMASGMDTHQIIDDLMEPRREQVNQLLQEREWKEMKRDAVREVNVDISNFQDRYADLQDESAFNAYTMSSDSNAVSGTATSSAMPGTYEVHVEQLAQTARLDSIGQVQNAEDEKASSSDRVLTEGETETFTITNGEGQEAEIIITDQDTFGSMATKISRATDEDGNSLGLNANFDNTTSKFYFSTRGMGEDVEIHFENSAFVRESIFGAPEAEAEDLQAAGQNAEVRFGDAENGTLVDDLTSNSVSFNGLELNLEQEGSAQINVSTDPDDTFDLIMSFVDDYNELIEGLDEKISEERYADYPPLTEEQRAAMSEREQELWDERAESGLLRNDASISSFLTNMRSALSQPVDGIGGGEIQQLSEIGITTGDYREGGKLHVDEDDLRNAITERPDEVMHLFTQSPAADVNDDEAFAHTGLAGRISDQMENTIDRLQREAGRPDSPIDDFTSNLARRMQRIDDQIMRREDRLQQEEERYHRQFQAMERAMNELNAQAEWMANNMTGMF